MPVVVTKYYLIPVEEISLNHQKNELAHLRRQLYSIRLNVKVLERWGRANGKI